MSLTDATEEQNKVASSGRRHSKLEERDSLLNGFALNLYFLCIRRRWSFEKSIASLSSVESQFSGHGVEMERSRVFAARAS